MLCQGNQFSKLGAVGIVGRYVCMYVCMYRDCLQTLQSIVGRRRGDLGHGAATLKGLC